MVDDSAFMRKALTMMLESDPAIKVVGTARDGEEGVAKVRQLKPDLVTMDIEMPRMDGLTALRQIMSAMPTLVMMISSVTTEGANATLQALELGAVDFIPKQMSYVSLDIVKIKDGLLAKIKDVVRRKHILMARYHVRHVSTAPAPPAPKPAHTHPVEISSPPRRHHGISIVAIGASTGGPQALQTVVSALPKNFPVGIVIAQHMPATFTKSLAERLNSLSQVTVREAENGDPVEPGLVLIAPGGKHLKVRRYGGRTRAQVTDEPADTLYKPCIDVMINSVAEAFGNRAMAVILTGMGSNGLVGGRLLKSRGGILIAQDEGTSIVYGMPKAVIEADITDHIAPIDNIAAEITSYF